MSQARHSYSGAAANAERNDLVPALQSESRCALAARDEGLGSKNARRFAGPAGRPWSASARLDGSRLKRSLLRRRCGARHAGRRRGRQYRPVFAPAGSPGRARAAQSWPLSPSRIFSRSCARIAGTMTRPMSSLFSARLVERMGLASFHRFVVQLRRQSSGPRFDGARCGGGESRALR